MVVESITPDLVRINDYYIEIRDSREPDYFDLEFERLNGPALATANAKPIYDREISLYKNLPSGLIVDPFYMAYQMIPMFIDLARKAAADRAISWRNFRVGAAVFAFDGKDGRAGFFFGANYKPRQDSTDLYCAEPDAIGKAVDRGFEIIPALAVVGPATPGEVNEHESPTLHPCDKCRNMLSDSPLISEEHTVVVTANDQGDIELMSVSGLLALHGHHSK